MTSQSFLPYGRQTVEEDDLQSIRSVLLSEFLTTGPLIEQFERQFCGITKAENTVVCGNGTQALHLACLAAGLKEGEVAIVPAITFLATANAVRYCGADVVFADVDPDTGLLTPDSLKEALTRADEAGQVPRAVLPVHLAGQTVQQDELLSVARKHDMTVISDTSHALGTTYKGHPAGSCVYEDMATFSFHPVKTIAMGEGGAITTSNPEHAEYMRRLRSHGMNHRPEAPENSNMGLDEAGHPNPWYYEMQSLGYNYRVTDIQCALGISQLNKLDRFIKKRKELAHYYDELLQPLSPVIKPPKRVSNCDPAWHLYAVRIDFDALGMSRSRFMDELLKQQIGTQVHYIPVHLQPYYKSLYNDLDLPGAMTYYQSTLSLPLFPSLTRSDVQRVVKAIVETLQHSS